MKKREHGTRDGRVCAAVDFTRNRHGTRKEVRERTDSNNNHNHNIMNPVRRKSRRRVAWILQQLHAVLLTKTVVVLFVVGDDDFVDQQPEHILMLNRCNSGLP